MQEETKFKIKVKSDLKETFGTDCWLVKIQQQSINGTPDLLICLCGIFVAIELKRDGKELPEEIQLYNLRKIQNAGGYSFTAYPENWGEILGQLQTIAKAKKANRKG